ncbi:MAG: hypothetical protein H6811_07410 [Phycisphaeraceae bacterium]|nr:hypothetical protein [Phycisphaeraceae bacterium]
MARPLSPISTLEPAPDAWRRLVQLSPHTERAAARSALGLPADRPIVATGHQAGIWHAGIVAKSFAADSLASKVGGTAVWIIVDQDDNDPTMIRYPKAAPSGASIGQWQLSPGAMVPEGTPTASRPGISPTDPPTDVHPGCRRAGLAAIAESLRRHRQEPSLASQFGHAMRDLAGAESGATGYPAPLLIKTSDLVRLGVMAELIDRIGRDPERCVAAYNHACAAMRDAGMRPLTLRDRAIELPLWRIRPGEPRSPVYASQLDSLSQDELFPRALLMTGALRWRVCDLFIHGTGGYSYDRVTQRWFEDWLGASLAPATMATATLTLPLSDGPVPTEADLQRARARAHRARHDPAMVGDATAAEAKLEILRQVDAAKSSGGNPAPLFAKMHALLGEHRRRNATEIAAIERRCDELASAMSLGALTQDRTWPVTLLPHEDVRDLREEIDRALSGA